MISADLSNIVLADPEGNPVRLGDAVDRPTVIDLVRYYGCAPCRVQLRELAANLSKLEGMGAGVLGIGPRAAYQAKLLSRRRVDFPLLLDPDHLVARAVGMGRQPLLRWIFDLRAWWRWLRALFRGGQGMVTSGWWEVPGIVIVDGSCRVRWLYRGKSMGDYPPLATTLEQLARVTGEVSPP